MEAITVESIQDLAQVLADRNIPISDWGIETGSKSVEQLFDEVQKGECTLCIDEEGVLFRRTNVARIYLTGPGGDQYLREAAQVTFDGRVRQRTLDSSMGEKIYEGETPTAAAYRALKEELEPLVGTLLSERGVSNVRKQRESYIGLITEYNFFDFEAQITEGRYAPMYAVVEPDGTKASVFIWTNEPF